ncbi:MAG: hypothetical protein JNL67_10100 [Planctomycetaceae bacterium]|nr:hypothetical protein [Planctomycetaceae bacterium]
MNSNKRRQASLFLSDQTKIESLRLRYNPVQAQLIPAHVTLCREDEVTDWGALRTKLELLVPFELTLEFGIPVRENDFVYLPVVAGVEAYQELRCKILSKEARLPMPHLTMIHPRNGTCTDEIFTEMRAAIDSPFQFTFREVRLIEQEGAGVWQVISRVGIPDQNEPGPSSHESCGRGFSMP